MRIEVDMSGKIEDYLDTVVAFRNIDKNLIQFSQIGKKSSAHRLAYQTFKRNPTPPVTDWGIARSLRSLGRISKNANILNMDGASNHQSKTDGIFAFNGKLAPNKIITKEEIERLV